MRLTPAKLTVVTGLVVGCLVSAYVAKKVLAQDEIPQWTADDRDYVRVPIAVSDLPAGTRITPLHLRFVRLPAAAVSADLLIQSEQLVGCTVRERIFAAEPIHVFQVYLPDESAVDTGLPGETAVAGPVEAPLPSQVEAADADEQALAAADSDELEDGNRFVAEVFLGTARSTIEFQDGHRIDGLTNSSR